MTTTATQAFAARVKAAAARIDRRPYSNKVWLHTLYGVDACGAESFEAFKLSLWQAANAGLVELARCDMVEAHKPINVRLSAMTPFGERGVTFNFLVCG